MTEEETGVSEGVADPVREPEQSDAHINWEATRKTMAEQKAALDLKDQQIAMMQQYLNQQTQAPVQQQPELSPFDEIDESDVMTGADLKRVMSHKEKEIQQKLESTQRELKLMSMRSQHSDYDEAVQNAMKLAETNPDLARAIQTSSDPHLLAYEMGKSTLKNEPSSKLISDAQKMVENAQKPVAASQATTGGGTLNAADNIWGMSNDDFETHIARIKSGQ